MATEIERKYLVVGDTWRSQAVGTVFRQGYLSTVKERIVRVRVAGDQGYLTIKGITVGAVRAGSAVIFFEDEVIAVLFLVRLFFAHR